jgi:glycosyltransferase involved in cell wall biosynthesis
MGARDWRAVRAAVVSSRAMMNGKKIAVVLPGLNVKGTLERTLRAIPASYVDASIFVDDGSSDGCGELAASLGCVVLRHARNLGYGAGQKTGYREALALGADVVVMVHPDFQYKPELVPAMTAMVAHGGYDLVLGSRLLVRGALAGGMPRWKYVANRGLTIFENLLMGSGLSEFHTGYRAFSRKFLEEMPLAENRNDYVFDNEVLAQAIHFGYAIGEMSCPAHYFDEMQTITFGPGVKYGIGCVKTAAAMRVHRLGLRSSPLFDRDARKLVDWREGVRVEAPVASAGAI